MTCLNVLHTNDRDDVTCLCRFHFVTVVCVHLNHTADTLSFTCCAVKNGITLLNLT
ncbi:Uncharacterised protein [Vibrio cholerae]|nr:Uncharacterised protein [Vibrio cholerae]